MNQNEKLELIKIFRIYKSTSILQISKNYKNLLIKHHPDKNPKNIKLANKNTIKLNEGYQYIKTHFKEIKSIIIISKIKNPIIKEIFPNELKSKYNTIIKILRINLFDYYNYNLNNFHNRKSGYLKYKFSIIIKNIKTIENKLIRLKKNNNIIYIEQKMNNMINFIKILQKYIHIKMNKSVFENSYDYNSYKIYKDASSYLDEAIFHDLKTTIFQEKKFKKKYSLSLSVKGFNNLLMYYENSNYISSSKIKLNFIKSYILIKKHQ